jgi:hypothetical protein
MDKVGHPAVYGHAEYQHGCKVCTVMVTQSTLYKLIFFYLHNVLYSCIFLTVSLYSLTFTTAIGFQTTTFILQDKTVHSLYTLIRANCVRCHGTKCRLLTVSLSSFFLSASVTFLPEGTIVGSGILHGVFISQKNVSSFTKLKINIKAEI